MTQRAKEMRELKWSCDERIRDPVICRNPYGCHCAEITALLDRLAAQADAPGRQEQALERIMTILSGPHNAASAMFKSSEAWSIADKALADAPGEPCEQCSAIPPTEHHPDCMYYGDAPGGLDAATVEACAKVADAVVARAERLMESDPKSARQTLAAVANGAMECAENIRAIAPGKKP